METSQGTPIRCPYEVGAIFHLYVSPPTGSPYEIHVAIEQAFIPFTISPVMRVSLNTTALSMSDRAHAPVDLPLEMILKVYDRRFAHSLREYYKGKPATYESEAQYQEYLASGPAADPDELDEQISEVCPAAGYEGCPPHLFEHLITFAMSPYYENECAAYERLAPLQGRDIPRFYGTVNVLDMDVDPPVQGVLLEVVPGVSLDKADPPSVNIDQAVRGAMRIIDSYYDLGLLNEDVHLGNFIVRPDGSVVMIDFAQSRLREEDESDEDWREAKEGADEEGCIGFKAKRKFGWPWVRGQNYYSRLTESDEADQLGKENEQVETSNPVEGESDAMDLVEETDQPNEDGETQVDGTGEVESGEMFDPMSNDASVEANGGTPIPHPGVIEPNISSDVPPLVAAPEPHAAEDAVENGLEGTSARVEGKSNGINLLDESNQPIGEGQSNGTSQSVVAGDSEATSNPDGVSESEGMIRSGRVTDQTTTSTSVGTVKGAPIRHSSSLGLNISLFVPHFHKTHAAAVDRHEGDSDEVDQSDMID